LDNKKAPRSAGLFKNLGVYFFFFVAFFFAGAFFVAMINFTSDPFFSLRLLLTFFSGKLFV